MGRGPIQKKPREIWGFPAREALDPNYSQLMGK
jgi:hypothetical protein